MSLQGALGISSGGLANVSYGLSIISQNIANASTPQYALETASQTSASANGQEGGVRSGLVILATDPGLQAAVSTQNAQTGLAAARNAALSALEPALGTVGAGNDLGSQLTAVQSAFSALLPNPADGTQQSAVVQAAATLARGINTLSNAYGTARQTAQDNVVSGVAQLNSALADIGALNEKIVSQRAQGLSTADLQNQRAQAERSVSGLVGARFADQVDGSVTIYSEGGAQLPTDGSLQLSTAPASVGATTYYPGGGIAPILLGGADITSQLTGGSIGANITLRDSTLPTYQGSLDEFAQNLSARFSAQGLNLFTDASGIVPTSTGPAPQSGYVGFASAIQVNPAIITTPSLVRDGTQAIAGSLAGASAFTPNPAGGPAGFAALISRVLDFALGNQQQAGVPQATIATSGLGANGNLQAGYTAQTDLLSAANAMTAAQANEASAAQSQSSDAQAVQGALQAKLSSATGVDMNTELGQMVILQNAFGANAKVISTIQQLFQTVLSMVA